MTDRPLTEKLGLKGQLRALILNAPKGYRTLLGPLPPDITVNTKPSGRYDFVHLFVANQAEQGGNCACNFFAQDLTIFLPG